MITEQERRAEFRRLIYQEIEKRELKIQRLEEHNIKAVIKKQLINGLKTVKEFRFWKNFFSGIINFFKNILLGIKSFLHMYFDNIRHHSIGTHILALCIFMLAILPVYSLVRHSNKIEKQKDTREEAVALARTLTTDIEMLAWKDAEAGPATRLGPDAGETIRADFDDIDDFHGYIDTPQKGMTRFVAVRYAFVDAYGNITQSVAPSTYKWVRVTISSDNNIFEPMHRDIIVKSF